MLLFIISLLIPFSYFTAVKFFGGKKESAKIKNIFTGIIICFVCGVYIILAAHSTKPQYFIPQKNLKIYSFAGNYYNWLTFNLTKLRLDLNADEKFIKYLTTLNSEDLKDFHKISADIKMFYDTSIYKNKVYLYFGITPVLLFYLPCYLVTGYFVSDHIVTAFLSILIFLLQMLIYKKIMDLINKKDFYNPAVLLILGLSSGVPLTYISITIHLIPILTNIFLSLAAVFVFLLILENGKYLKLKIFLTGSFCALSVGARPANIIFLFIMFLLIVIYIYIKKKFFIKMPESVQGNLQCRQSLLSSKKLQSFQYVQDFHSFNNFQCRLKYFFYFIIPCIFYGTVISVYNYLRFNSLFDFGFAYQFSSNYMQNILKPFSLVFQFFFNNIFFLPKFILREPFVIFGSSSLPHFEPLAGGIIIFPLIISFLFLPKIFKYDKNIFFLFSALFFMSIIYLIINSYKGFNARFVAEYLFLLLVPSVVLFYRFRETLKNKKIYNFVTAVFYILIIFSLYINTNLISSIFFMSREKII